jgi:hypothetical protein
MWPLRSLGPENPLPPEDAFIYFCLAGVLVMLIAGILNLLQLALA